jgi:hypothetical protein
MRIPVMLLCIVFILSACNDNDTNNNDGNNGIWESNFTYQRNENLPQLRAEWEREYEAWKELDIQDYQFVYNDAITYPVQITIKEGILYSVAARGTQGHSSEETIDDLFMAIARGFDSDDDTHYPEQIGTSYTVRYNAQYHYPEYYLIVHVYVASGAIGNYWGFSVNKFSRLEDLEEETYQPNENMPQLLAEWEREYKAWKSLNIQNYQYLYQQCLDPNTFKYWDYRSRITVKNGQFQDTVGLSPDGYQGNYLTIDEIFHDIYSRFEEDIYYGWDNWPKIGT